MIELIRMTEKKLIKVAGYAIKKLRVSKDPQHNWEHVKRVGENAKKIVKLLGLEDKLDLNLLLATCYLHDISYSKYSPGLVHYFLEGKRSKKLIPNILNRLGIKGDEKRIIENSIYSSSFSFPFGKLNKDKDLYAQILQDADTIDFFSLERQESYKIAKKSNLFYRLLGPFSMMAIKYGRGNIRKYLNFPVISENFNV